jgi:hypothetical protein
LGSFIARRMAEIALERVRRLILIGPSLTAANEVTLEVAQIVANLEGVVPPESAREFCADTIHAPCSRCLAHRPVCESWRPNPAVRTHSR